MTQPFVIAALAFVMSASLTWVLARQFDGTSLMDLPNERSSHTIAKPRGGGLAIVCAYVLAISILHAAGLLSVNTWLAFGLTGLAIGLGGFLDDQRVVTLEFRLLTQFAAAIAGLLLLGGFPALDLGAFTLDLGWLGNVIGCLFLVWMMNLFNFMDGIDGIAASQASFVCLAACALAGMAGLGGEFQYPALMGAAAAAGFLVWNFPPARIFLGSVGSEYLGFLIGMAALQLAQADSHLFFAVLILAAAFVSDATITLAMRVLKGDNPLRPHRTHVYQLLAQRFGAHRPVTLAYAALNLLWLAPIAFLTVRANLSPLFAVPLAYAPLIAFTIIYRTHKAALA